MHYIGLDIHKKFCIATIMDKEGTILCQNQRIDTTPQALQSFFSTIKKGKVAIESSTVWEHIYETLTTLGLEVNLVNPLKAQVIAEAKIKTDKVDSHILAHLLRTNLIPIIYIGTKNMRDLKRLITEKIFLTKQQTQLKNRIHTTLLRQGIHTTRNIFTHEKQAYLHKTTSKNYNIRLFYFLFAVLLYNLWIIADIQVCRYVKGRKTFKHLITSKYFQMTFYFADPG